MQRFGPTAFDDFIGSLTKIRQTGTVREYQTKFEKLDNHIEGLFDAFYRSCFISNLKDAIWSEVKMLWHSTMMEELGLDNLEKDNIIAQECSKCTFDTYINMVSQRPPLTPTPRTTPIKHLFEFEM